MAALTYVWISISVLFLDNGKRSLVKFQLQHYDTHYDVAGVLKGGGRGAICIK